MTDSSRRKSEVKSLGDTGLRALSGAPRPLKKSIPKTNSDSQKLQSLVGQSEVVIFCVTTVFHFSLERYELIIDRAKITVIKRLFLLADSITSVGLNDLLSVKLNAGPVFGSLILKARYVGRPVVINYLTLKKAFRAKQIIDGLIVATNKGIGLDKIPMDELTSEIIKIGIGIR